MLYKLFLLKNSLTIHILLITFIVTIIPINALSKKVENRYLYVDDFSIIIDDSQMQDSLLDYAQTRDITSLLLYELNKVNKNHNLTDTSTNKILANFIKKAKTNYGINTISAIGENYDFFKNIIVKYNTSRNDSNEKFDAYNLEFEFWNVTQYYCNTYLQPNNFSCDTAGAFRFYMTQIDSISSYITDSSLSLDLQTYVGWFNQGQAKEISKDIKNIFLHAYVKNPSSSFSYTKDRLYMLSRYYKTNISIIFSSEDDLMGNWLINNSINQAETIYTTDYNNDTTINKQNINLDGFTYFAYTFMDSVFLPIELLQFYVDINQKYNNIIWKIIPRKQIKYYEIEKRYKNEKEFHLFSRVNTYPNCKPICTYKLIDKDESYEIFYRLSSITNNAERKILGTTFATGKSLHFYVEKIYPNPAINLTNILISCAHPITLKLEIINSCGEKIYYSSIPLKKGKNKIKIPTINYSSGIYFIIIGEIKIKFIINH